MKAAPLSVGASKKRRMILLAGAVTAGLLFVLFANVHLVYVSVTSQPECVAHVRADAAQTASGKFAAAKSSC